MAYPFICDAVPGANSLIKYHTDLQSNDLVTNTIYNIAITNTAPQTFLLSSCWAAPLSPLTLPEIWDNQLYAEYGICESIPSACCFLSPETAPTTASFFPTRRSIVPSAYPLAWAALYSASPLACSSFPACCQEVEPVKLPAPSTTLPLTEWYWPEALLQQTRSSQNMNKSRVQSNASYLGSLELLLEDMV